MRYFVLAVFMASSVSAQPLLVTNSFNNNSVADADAVNRNFADITNGLNTRLNIYTGTPFNTAVGYETLVSNVGFRNTASGYQALSKNTYGDDNTASGFLALYNNTDGYENTASGRGALYNNTTGYWNTASGAEALYNNTTGFANTAIGYLAGNGFGAENATNSTVIGFGARFFGNNQVQIGNSDITDVYLGRRDVIGSTGADANLRLEGNVIAGGIVLSSDGRLKENVTAVTEGLSLVNDLNPVRYHRINERSGSTEMGLVAQEVQATLKAHNLNSGMVHQSDSSDYLYLRYNDLMAPMIRAIQELDDASEAKDKQIASLEQKLASQQEELLAIVQSQQEQIAQLQQMVEHQFAAR